MCHFHPFICPFRALLALCLLYSALYVSFSVPIMHFRPSMRFQQLFDIYFFDNIENTYHTDTVTLDAFMLLLSKKNIYPSSPVQKSIKAKIENNYMCVLFNRRRSLYLISFWPNFHNFPLPNFCRNTFNTLVV